MTAPAGTGLLERTDLDPLTGKPRLAHIVKPKNGRSGADLVMEARVYGTEVEALCGHRWVPQRDPKQYPVCPECARLFEEKVGQPDGWESS